MGVRFSAPIQNGLGVHPTSYTMGTGSVPGSRVAGRGVDHPPLSSTEAEVKERVQLYIYSPLPPVVPSWPLLG